MAISSKITKLLSLNLSPRARFLFMIVFTLVLVKLFNLVGNKIFTNIFAQESLAYYLLLYRTAVFVSGLALLNFSLALQRLGSEYYVRKEIDREKNRGLITAINNFRYYRRMLKTNKSN